MIQVYFKDPISVKPSHLCRGDLSEGQGKGCERHFLVSEIVPFIYFCKTNHVESDGIENNIKKKNSVSHSSGVDFIQVSLSQDHSCHRSQTVSGIQVISKASF